MSVDIDSENFHLQTCNFFVFIFFGYCIFFFFVILKNNSTYDTIIRLYVYHIYETCNIQLKA